MKPHSPLVSFVSRCYGSVQFSAPCVESVSSRDRRQLERVVAGSSPSDGTVDIVERRGGHVDSVSERKAMCAICYTV